MFQSFINRPSMTAAIYIFLSVTGAILLLNAEVSQYPVSNYIDFAESIRISYPGSSEEIESSIVNVIEEYLKNIEGIKKTHSSSTQDFGNIVLYFHGSTSRSDARAAIATAINNAKINLPSSAIIRTISHGDNSNDSILTVSLSSKILNNEKIYQYCKDNLLHELETIKGIAHTRISGVGESSIIIHVNNDLMSMHKIPYTTLTQGLDSIRYYKKSIFSFPVGGKTISAEIIFDREDIPAEQRIANIQMFNEDGESIKMSEIAPIIEKKHNESFCKLNNHDLISIDFTKEEGGNILTICKEIKEKLNYLKFAIEKQGIQYEIFDDKSIFIQSGIDKVFYAIVEAIILTSIVVFIFQSTNISGFFQNLKLSMIPILAIPFSIIPVGIIMHIFNCSLNIYTLFALVLAIGLVVDDAIVVLDHVIHKINEKIKLNIKVTNDNILQVISEAISEIYVPIIITTLTVAIVYMPLLVFRKNEMIAKFYEFAVVLSGSVFISGFVSLTLSPLMIYKMLNINDFINLNIHELKNTESNNSSEDQRSQFEKFEDYYIDTLKFIFKNNAKFLFSSLFIVITIGTIVFHKLEKQAVIPVDESQIMIVPSGGAYQAYNSKYKNEEFTKLVKSIAEYEIAQDILATFFVVSREQNYLKIYLKKINDRKFSFKEIQKKLNGILFRSSASFPLMIAMEGQNGFTSILKIFGGSVDDLIQANNNVKDYISSSGIHFTFQECSRAKKCNLFINNDICSLLKIHPEIILNGVSLFQKDSYRYEVNDKKGSYKIYIHPTKLINNNKDDESISFEDILNVPVKKLSDNTLINAGTVIDKIDKECFTYTTIAHHNSTRGLSINWMTDQLTFNKFKKHIEYINKNILDQNAAMFIDDDTLKNEEKLTSVIYAFTLAIFCITIALIMQFNSFVYPLIIIFVTIPVATSGAFIGLMIFNQKINVASLIGAITLIGLIAKHGILIIDKANLEKKLSPLDAIITACKVRIKPILMTTICMILGALPLAYKTCEFSEYRIPIGISIIGGMSFGTILTLFILPSAYLFCRMHITNDSDIKINKKEQKNE